MVDTIILAGGKSSRFTRNKLAELYQGKPLIYYTIRTFLEVSNSVIIVTGHYDVSYLDRYLSDPRIRIVHNSNYEQGMFTSVQKGVNQLRNNFFLIPGDYPLVKGETLETLLDHRGPIRVPVYQNRKGHPIYIAKELIPALLEEPPDSNLKAFRDRYDVTYIPVPDRGVILDVDRMEDITLLQAEREE